MANTLEILEYNSCDTRIKHNRLLKVMHKECKHYANVFSRLITGNLQPSGIDRPRKRHIHTLFITIH